MIAKHIAFSNIINIVSDILLIRIQEPLLISKMFIVLLHTLSAYVIAYSSTIKFTRLISGNVCVQAAGMLKSMNTLVLIQRHIERILLKRKKLSYQIFSP